jgi:hypothetical protein
MLTLTLAIMSLTLLGASAAMADEVVFLPPGADCYAPAPAVSYYTPAPQATYYTPSVSYYTPSVSYYAVPSVSYYTPAVTYYTPSVSYYAAPAAVTTTTRYGLFGRPRVRTTTYYP